MSALHRVRTLGAVALAVGLLAGCGQTLPQGEQAQAIARCVAQTASSDELFAMGEAYAANLALPLTRRQTWACDTHGWNAVALDSTYRKALEPALAQAVLGSAAGRQGVYSMAAGNAVSRASRQALGALGLQLDEGRRAALQAHACRSLAPEAMAVIEPLNLPFATATVGVRAGLGDPAQAQALAQQLLERVDMLTGESPEAQAMLDCRSDDGRERYLAHARVLQQFAQGVHPWTPGCGVQEHDDELVLRCEGASDLAQ